MYIEMDLDLCCRFRHISIYLRTHKRVFEITCFYIKKEIVVQSGCNPHVRLFFLRKMVSLNLFNLKQNAHTSQNPLVLIDSIECIHGRFTRLELSEEDVRTGRVTSATLGHVKDRAIIVILEI